MRKSKLFVALGLLALAGLAIPVVAQNAGGGAPSAKPAAGAGDPGARPEGPPPGGVHLIPRFAEQKLNLTDDQKVQIAALEKETKEKLDKILTDEQKKTLQEARPPRRPDGPGGPGGSGAPKNAPQAGGAGGAGGGGGRPPQ